LDNRPSECRSARSVLLRVLGQIGREQLRVLRERLDAGLGEGAVAGGGDLFGHGVPLLLGVAAGHGPRGGGPQGLYAGRGRVQVRVLALGLGFVAAGVRPVAISS